MGNLIGISRIVATKNQEISQEHFESVWEQFARKENNGIISLNRTKRFAQEWALSHSKPYNPNNERKIRLTYDREGKGCISKQYFLHYFVQTVKEEGYTIENRLLQEYRKIDSEIQTLTLKAESEKNEKTNKNESFDENTVTPNETLEEKNIHIIDLENLRDDYRHFHTLSFSCWVYSNGKHYSWAHNNFGQCAHNNISSPLLQPMEVRSFPSKVLMISLGYIHVSILTEKREVYCIGDSTYHQCGQNPIQNKWSKVDGLPNNINYISAGGNFTAVLTEDGKVYGWGKSLLSNEPVKDPIELRVLGVDRISRIFSWGIYLFMEEAKSKLWFGNPLFFKSEVQEFRAINKINNDKRLFNNIKLLEGSPFGLFVLTYDGNLFVYVRDKKEGFLFSLVSPILNTKVLDISCGNTTGSNVILDVEGRVYTFIFTQSKFVMPKDGVYEVQMEKVNIGEKATQVAAAYENCMAIGLSKRVYTWGRNGYAQNGNKSTSPISHFSPHKVDFIEDCSFPISGSNIWSKDVHFNFSNPQINKKIITIYLCLKFLSVPKPFHYFFVRKYLLNEFF